MTERNGYAPGTPSWADLTTSQPEAAMAFYGELFGWELERGAAEFGGYTMCRLRGRRVAGINGQPAPPGMPPAWIIYLATDDADATAARVGEAGGRVMMGPMDVADQGRMLLAADPTGALVGFWQPGEHTGAELIGEPGTMAWHELATTDLDAAQAFYAAVCGHTATRADMGPDAPEYRTLQLGGEPVAGMLAMAELYPEGVPPHWLPYFGVADADAAAALVRDRGGQVLTEPADSSYGRWAMVTDPQGAAMTLLQRPAD